MNSDSESKESLLSKLHVEAHPIIRNFPACVSHFAAFRAVFVQDRICVVYVNQDPPTRLCKITLREQTIRCGKRNVPNFASRLRPHSCGNQFVLVPECSVKKAKVARSRPVLPFLGASGKSGGVKDLLAS